MRVAEDDEIGALPEAAPHPLEAAGARPGRLDRMRRRFGGRAELIVFGHSHMPLHEQAPDGFQILNPGSPTERRRAPRHTMGLIRVANDSATCEVISL